MKKAFNPCKKGCFTKMSYGYATLQTGSKTEILAAFNQMCKTLNNNEERVVSFLFKPTIARLFNTNKSNHRYFLSLVFERFGTKHPKVHTFLTDLDQTVVHQLGLVRVERSIKKVHFRIKTGGMI